MCRRQSFRLRSNTRGEETIPFCLWLRTQNFMDRGVDLTWISAFPHERTFLCPPLTYMTPVREEPVVVQIGGATYQVIEVKVQM